jgi:hypothetical protein
MIRGGDFSMLKVWAGLEARSFLQASAEAVSVSDTVLTDYININLGGTMRQVRSAVAKHLAASVDLLSVGLITLLDSSDYPFIPNTHLRYF